MKKLTIKLKKESIEINLTEKGKLMISDNFKHDENLSENLLVRIEALMKSSDIEISEVDDFECETDQPESYTSTRIVRAITESFKLAKKLSCQTKNCG